MSFETDFEVFAKRELALPTSWRPTSRRGCPGSACRASAEPARQDLPLTRATAESKPARYARGGGAYRNGRPLALPAASFIGPDRPVAFGRAGAVVRAGPGSGLLRIALGAAAVLRAAARPSASLRCESGWRPATSWAPRPGAGATGLGGCALRRAALGRPPSGAAPDELPLVCRD